MRERILGKDRKAKARDKLGQGMVDLGVVMVGTAGEHDAVTAVSSTHSRASSPIVWMSWWKRASASKAALTAASTSERGDLGTAHATATGLRIGHTVDGEHLVQTALELGLVVIGHKRVQELDVLLGESHRC